MSKRSAVPSYRPDRVLPTLWAAAAAAFWLVPDQKLARAKLVAVQTAVLLAGARLLWTRVAEAQPGRRSPLDLPVAALALGGLAFWALSPERAASETEAARLLLCGLAFWTASRSLAGDAFEAFASAWTAAAAAAGLWAVAQALDGHARPFASFGNPILLGVALAAALPLAAVRAPRSLPWTAALALQAAGLLLARSRAAVLGLSAALALWAWARLGGRARRAAIAAAAVSGAGAIWLSQGREWTHGLIWRDALALWRARPWLGWGLGRFHLEFPAYASAELKARWPEGAVIINFAHNEYLQTLAETGPLGLAALLAVPAAAFLALRREPDPARAACAAGALALFCAALVSPDLRLGASAFAAFALLGACAPAAAAPAAAARGAAPAALLLAGLAGFGWLAARPVLAVRRNAGEASFYAGADARRVRELEARLEASPKDADAAEELGYLKAKASDFPGAIAAFRRAAELAPSRPGPLNNLGNLAYLSGDPDGAIAWWEMSLSADPGQIDARLNLAKLLCERGRLKACAQSLQEVLRRDPSNARARVLYKKMVE